MVGVSARDALRCAGRWWKLLRREGSGDVADTKRAAVVVGVGTAGDLPAVAELERVDAWLDDGRFFAPFVAFFDPRIGRPSVALAENLIRPG